MLLRHKPDLLVESAARRFPFGADFRVPVENRLAKLGDGNLALWPPLDGQLGVLPVVLERARSTVQLNTPPADWGSKRRIWRHQVPVDGSLVL